MNITFKEIIQTELQRYQSTKDIRNKQMNLGEEVSDLPAIKIYKANYDHVILVQEQTN